MREIFNQEVSAIYTDADRAYLVIIDRWNFKRIIDAPNPEIFYWVYKTEGDCCSHSWFESISNIENLIGQEVIGIEKKEEKHVKCDHDSPDSSCEKAYGYTLKTEKGYSDIEFRNSSNAFYGGECFYIPFSQTELVGYESWTVFPPSCLLLKVTDDDYTEAVDLFLWGNPPVVQPDRKG